MAQRLQKASCATLHLAHNLNFGRWFYAFPTWLRRFYGGCLALPHALQGQNSLVVHVDGLSEDTVYLAHYYGAKLFYNDTAVVTPRDRDLRGEAV